jgi:uncharacterized protein (TIGR00290 family)
VALGSREAILTKCHGITEVGSYALLWSGGKDSALAFHRARSTGLEVSVLISFFDAQSGRVRFHGTRAELLQDQANALGVELRAAGTAWPDMEARLLHELARLREEGFAGVILGDIHLADVRAWYESRVRAAGLEHVEPIWGEPPAGLIREFVRSGGRAVVTCVDLTRLEERWLGRLVDERFVEEIDATGVDPCGENGEYHSFAFDGPPFQHPVSWRLGETRTGPRFSQVELLRPAAAGHAE